MVDAVAHPGFGAGGQRLSRGEPPHAAVFIGLYPQWLGIIGFDEIGAVEMQVGGDIPPSFFVSIHGKDLDREQFTTDGAERLQSGFLGYLPQCDRQKVGLSIGMATGINPEILHRVASISANGLDSMPWCGAVMTMFAVCGVTHKDSYKDVAVVNIVITMTGAILAILLGTMGIC